MNGVVVMSTPSAVQQVTAAPPGGLGEPTMFTVRAGQRYALRTSTPVLYRSGSGGSPSATDTQILPDAPLHVFEADVEVIVVCAIGAAGSVSLFRVVK